LHSNVFRKGASQGRIAFVNPGIRRHRIPLFQGLSRLLGKDLALLLTNFDYLLRKEHVKYAEIFPIIANGSAFHPCSSLKIPLLGIQAPIGVYTHLMKNRYDVIIWGESEYSLLPLLLTKSLRVHKPKIVVWTSRWKKSSRVLGRIYQKMMLAVLRNCDYVACASKFSLEYFERGGFPLEKLCLVEEGSAGGTMPKRNQPASSYSSNPPVIGYIGQLIPRKGVDVLLRAFKKVLASSPDAQLWIAGEGPQKDDLVELAKALGLGASVRFIGFVEDASEFYDKVGIIAYPTRFDPQGLVIAEALSRGVPVVTTKAAGLSYYITDGVNGLVVEPGDDNALAEAILSYCKSVEVRSRLKEGALESSSQHTMSDMVDSFAAIVRKFLGDPRTANQLEMV
jgi:glycosyltransferase involved in cell wall biosynthesis